MRHSTAIRRRVRAQIIADKRAKVELLGEDDMLRGKDLLSVLIRANMKENEAERLDNKTLLAGERPPHLAITKPYSFIKLNCCI